MNKKMGQLEAKYKECLKELGTLGYISQGSVYERAAGKPGSRYQWSWKNAEQKTESVALSEEQYQWLKDAVANQRKANKVLGEMRKISRQILLTMVPGPERRK